MRSRASLAGLGALAFSVLTIVGLLFSSIPGGNYSAHDAAKYISRGHHVAVFIALYLLLLATFGLIVLLAHLREVTFGGAATGWTGRVFWGTSLVAAACLAIGYSLALGVAMATAFGGHSITLAPNVVYMLVEMGSAAVWGAGGILLGCALLMLFLGSRALFPAWLRWATAVGALGGILAPAFFPSALLIIWGVVIGIWLLMRGQRETVPAAAAA